MTEVPELALTRYSEFVESFNKLKLVDYELDIKTFDYTEMLKTFYEKISPDQKLGLLYSNWLRVSKFYVNFMN